VKGCRLVHDLRATVRLLEMFKIILA
jgi:hypothetical protein